MTRCEGLHCSGCGDSGHGGLVLAGGGILMAMLAAEWVAAHAWEVIAVTAVCGALAVAAVVALVRWASRRDARHANERPFLTVREVSIPVVESAPPGSEIPAPGFDGERPALGFRDLHIHLAALDGDEQARIIRTALTEGKG